MKKLSVALEKTLKKIFISKEEMCDMTSSQIKRSNEVAKDSELRTEELTARVDNIIKDVNQSTVDMVLASKGTININPYGLLYDRDYKQGLTTSRGELVEDVTPGSVSALKFTGNTYSFIADERTPIPKNKKYRATIDIKVTKNGVPDDVANSYITYYVGTVSYDGDSVNPDPITGKNLGNVIYPQHITYIEDPNDATKPVVATITRKFVKGSTELFFRIADINQFNLRTNANGKEYSHYRSLKFHRSMPDGTMAYVAKNGRVHSHYGMSQDNIYNGFVVLDDTKAEGDITRYAQATGETVEGEPEYVCELKSASSMPWKGKFDYYDVGDTIVQSYGGGTYSYWLSAIRVPVTAKFIHFKSPWVDFSTQDGKNGYTRYRDGTAFIKVMLLPNYKYYNGTSEINTPAEVVSYAGNIALEFSNTDL